MSYNVLQLVIKVMFHNLNSLLTKPANNSIS